MASMPNITGKIGLLGGILRDIGIPKTEFINSLR